MPQASTPATSENHIAIHYNHSRILDSDSAGSLTVTLNFAFPEVYADEEVEFYFSFNAYPLSAFMLRFVGPSIVLGSVRPVINREPNTHYGKFRIYDAGSYKMQLILLHKNMQEAFPQFPDVVSQPMWQGDYPDIEPTVTVSAKAEPPTAPLQPCPAMDNSAPGRWLAVGPSTNGEKQRYEWQPFNCSLRRYSNDGVRSCLEKKRLYVLGDSNEKNLVAYLRGIARNASITFVFLDGIVTTNVRGKAVVQPPQRNTQKLHQYLLDLKLANPQPDAVLLESCAWDVRDWSVQEYVELFHYLTKVWPYPRGEGPPVIWRTCPPWPYLRKSFGGREYRTNNKLEQAVFIIKLMAYLRGWIVDDFFTAALPRFDEPCDDHHYICCSGPGKRASGNVGIPYQQVLFNMLCNVGADSKEGGG